jgi:hypothetical protein
VGPARVLVDFAQCGPAFLDAGFGPSEQPGDRRSFSGKNPVD